MDAKFTRWDSYEKRLWGRIDKSGGPDACWLWKGTHTKHGYGLIFEGHKAKLTHRVVYELLVGPIPENLVLDHFYCNTTACCNPKHLEPVTSAINVLRGFGLPSLNSRKTHCDNGHIFDLINTYIDKKDNYRHCRECRKLNRKLSYHRVKARLENRDKLIG